MKAIVLVGPRRIEVVDDWPEPRLGRGDVLIAMEAIGLCGSDLGVFEGKVHVPSTPWLVGHEGGGVIVAVGAAVRDRFVGQRVAIEPNICCFECAPCKSGLTSSCLNRRVLGIKEPGIAVQHVAIPAAFTWPLPPSVSAETLALFEPWVVTQAAIRRSSVAAGDHCLVIGAGSQGLLLSASLLAVGATPYVIEPHAGRFALALQLGAQDAATGPDAYPHVFETSGAAPALEMSLRSVMAGRTITVIGQSTKPTEITTREVVQRQITIRGSLIYDHPLDFAAATTSIPEGICRVLQARTPADEAASAFATVNDVAGKSWIDLSAWQTDPR